MENSATNTQMPVTKKRSSKVIIIILVILLFGLFAIVGLIGLGIYSFSNNKQIPIISDTAYAVYKLAGHPKTIVDSLQAEGGKVFQGLLIPSLEKSGVDLAKLNIDPQNRLDSFKFEEKMSIADISIDSTLKLENLEVIMAGSFDQSSIDNVLFNSTFQVNVTVSGLALKIPGEITYIDNNLYIKFSKIPSILAMYVDLSKIDNKWIQIDKDTLISMMGSDEITATGNSLTKEDIQNLMKNNSIFSKNVQKLPTEQIKGNSTYCLGETLDKQAFAEEMNSTQDLTRQILGNNVTNETYKYKIENVDVYVEVCINKKTSRIHREKVVMTGDINANVDVIIWDYNKDTNIIVPDSYININELENLLENLVQ